MSIVGFVLTMTARLLDKNSLIDSLIETSFWIPFLIPFIYYGSKLKRQGTTNLTSVNKISRGMIIYTTLFMAINILFGAIGLLWLVLLYFYYKSYLATGPRSTISHS